MSSDLTILCLGASGTGKSTLIQLFKALICHTPASIVHPYSPTIESWCQFQYTLTRRKNIFQSLKSLMSKSSTNSIKSVRESCDLNLNLVEVGGSEDYQSLIPSAIKKSDAFLLVYNPRNRTSFHQIWSLYNRIVQVKETNKKNLDVVIVANDLSFGENSSDPIVTFEMGLRMAASLRTLYSQVDFRKPETIFECLHTLIVRASGLAFSCGQVDNLASLMKIRKNCGYLELDNPSDKVITATLDSAASLTTPTLKSTASLATTTLNSTTSLTTELLTSDTRSITETEIMTDISSNRQPCKCNAQVKVLDNLLGNLVDFIGSVEDDDECVDEEEIIVQCSDTNFSADISTKDEHVPGSPQYWIPQPVSLPKFCHVNQSIWDPGHPMETFHE